MNQKNLLSATALLTVSLTAFSTSSLEAQQKPNIIFVLLDDLGKEWLNCYGGIDIKYIRKIIRIFYTKSLGPHLAL